MLCLRRVLIPVQEHGEKPIALGTGCLSRFLSQSLGGLLQVWLPAPGEVSLKG